MIAASAMFARRRQLAQKLGRMGGKARAEGMSAKPRKEIAKAAATKRWDKTKHNR
jgi:hypothetical protein